MTRILITVITFTLLFSACAQNESEKINLSAPNDHKQEITFVLNDFFGENDLLDDYVDSIFNKLNAHQKVAQLIMPAIGEHGQNEATIDQLVKEGKIGGLLMLNGTKDQFTKWISKYNNWNDSLSRLPFLYSADAEPSLVNRKIINSTPVTKANKLQSKKEVVEVAKTISKDLNEIGINYNFAPVVDMSPNKTVGWRSFGHKPDSVIPWSAAFVKETQKHQIIATAKHFPGHGFVEGDTHKKLVYIDGEMKELINYPQLIKENVMSIMIAHIAVRNNSNYNTSGLPATISRKIVTELLKDSLNFKGLIVTDAMNMGGVSSIKSANSLAILAGCDILLMPLNANEAHKELLEMYVENQEAKTEIDNSVKKIIRAKLCLGIVKK
jgi:beta-N-acetylhexosaminidase